MSLPCVSWHPSATTSSYVRASSMSVCSFDVGRCTFASHCAPAFLSDACHHRTLHHCWLRSTGEGESFLPLLLLLSCSPLPPFMVRIQSAHSKVLKGCFCHFRSRSIISYHRTDGEILAWSLPFPSGEGFVSTFRMAIFYSSSISAFKSFLMHS